MKTEMILFILIGIILIVMFCSAIRTERKQAAKKFEDRYKEAARFVRDCPNTDEYRLRAKIWLIRLKKMPCADKEKLGVLKSEIIRKFGNEMR